MRWILRSKIHKAIVTEADLDYVGSITIDEDLINKVGFMPGEKVLVVDNTKDETITRVNGLGDLSHASLVYSPDERFAYVFGRDGGLTKVDIVERKIANGLDATIRRALEGNICRCTGYHNIVKAIRSAAAATA